VPACEEAHERLVDDVILALDRLAHVGTEAGQGVARRGNFGGWGKITHGGHATAVEAARKRISGAAGNPNVKER
jgi:hypothetical protein